MRPGPHICLTQRQDGQAVVPRPNKEDGKTTTKN